MKALLALVLVAVATPSVSLACDENAKDSAHACGHAANAVAASGDASAKGDKVVIPVAGMHCGMCAQRVTAALANIAGVKFVETTLDGKRAVIVYDRARAKPEAFVAAIKDAGYEPGAPKAN